MPGPSAVLRVGRRASPRAGAGGAGARPARRQTIASSDRDDAADDEPEADVVAHGCTIGTRSLRCRARLYSASSGVAREEHPQEHGEAAEHVEQTERGPDPVVEHDEAVCVGLEPDPDRQSDAQHVADEHEAAARRGTR